MGIAPPLARPNHPNVPQKWNAEEKRCGVTMLDYKEEDPQDDVWECGSIVRNGVIFLNISIIKLEFIIISF